MACIKAEIVELLSSAGLTKKEGRLL